MLQAALPLAVTSFVYAEEYKVHADIMSTGSVPFKYFYYLLPLFAEFQYWIINKLNLLAAGLVSFRVILGIFISLPVTIVYYILLGL